MVHVRGLASRFFIGIVRSASHKPIESFSEMAKSLFVAALFGGFGTLD